MAHIKTGGTTKGNRDSRSKRLGMKVYGGSKVHPGSIIVRQRGSKFHAGIGVKMGRDFTLYAVVSGFVEFKQRMGRQYIQVVE